MERELITAFGDDFDSIKLKGNITKIPKLRAYIHEILRVHPILPTTGIRKIVDEGVIVGPYNLPLGAEPKINVAAIHHNPKYWIKDYDEEKHGVVNMEDIHLEFWMEDGVLMKYRVESADKSKHDWISKKDYLESLLIFKHQ